MVLEDLRIIPNLLNFSENVKKISQNNAGSSGYSVSSTNKIAGTAANRDFWTVTNKSQQHEISEIRNHAASHRADPRLPVKSTFV